MMEGSRPPLGRRVSAMLCWLMAIGGVGTTVDLANAVPAATGGEWVVSIGLTVAFAVFGYYLWTTPKDSASRQRSVVMGASAGAQPQLAAGFVPQAGTPQARAPQTLEPYDLSVSRQVVFNYDELEFPEIADVIEGRIATLDVPMRVVRLPNREGERMRLGMEVGGRILTELGPEHVDFDLLSRYVGHPAIAHFSHDADGLAIRFSVQPQ